MPKAEAATYALLIITALVLAALKLTGIAKISWAIVLFPIWGPIAIFILLCVLTMLVTLLVMLYSIFIERRNP